jgi:hypothetical protein
MIRIRTPLAALVLLLLAGCSGQLPRLPQPGGAAGSHPGFDTWRFPGEAALRAWRIASPYRWVGYYLPAPCHRDASWAGTRPLLERVGFGTAILYVGQQAFEGAEPSEATAENRVLCSRTLLTTERGRADARDAIVRTAAEGFAPGSVIFLDVERMESIPPAMLAYYEAWISEVLAEGRYLPGTYAHRHNASTLFGLAQAVYLRAGRRRSPPFWVASASGFTLRRAPRDVGLPFADVWQGALDVDRTWGGVTLRVDENVASSPSPSAPTGS